MVKRPRENTTVLGALFVGTKNPNDSSSNNAPLALPTAEQTNNQQSRHDSSNQTKIAAEDSSKRGVSNLPAWMTAGK